MKKIELKHVWNEVKIAYYMKRYDLARDPIARCRHLANMMRCLTMRPTILWQSYEKNGVR